MVAIDVHTHAEVGRTGEDGLDPKWREAAAAYFGEGGLPTVADVAAYYRERNMAAVVFTRRRRDADGAAGGAERGDRGGRRCERRRADPVREHRPGQGPRAVTEARRLIADHGVRGFKFHPNLQAFYPNDRAVYPLYEVIAEAGLPASSTPATRGSAPVFPVAGASASSTPTRCTWTTSPSTSPSSRSCSRIRLFPWQDEALSVALHKQQVWIDLSGWSPKYFPENLVRYANTLLKERVLFGSDYPLITPDRWLADFEQAGFKDEVRPLVLKENAARLLGLR